MFDCANFQDVFPPGSQLPYDRNKQQEIEAARKTLDGTLFIDRVIKALGISKAKTYPPKTDNALRQLHQNICEASMSMHHKLSLLYYILLDFQPDSGRPAISDRFAMASGMPQNYQIFMKGLWHMDRLEFPRALEYVSHPSLIPDFADDIITALVRHAPDGDPSLALSYYYTVQPILKTSAALELIFGAMARSDVTEALLFSRARPGHVRELLFNQLLATVLRTEQKGGAASTKGAGDLAFLPLDGVEEAWFEEYLTNGDGKGLRRAKETLLARKIARDQLVDVGRLKVGGQWAPIVQGIRAGIEGHEN